VSTDSRHKSGEFANADLLNNGLLARDAELLFDLHFHGQPVGVPTGPTRNESSLHGLVTTEEVLVDARPHVVQTRHSVCRWRTLVEDPRRCALAVLHRAREDIIGLPTREFDFFYGHKIKIGADGAKHGLLQ
jgi:hypothetical protein